MIDLHVHSNYSDGSDSIEEILSKAKDLGLKQISITDHNILEGSIKASKISDVDFIVGTELSVDYHAKEVHLLAYFPNNSDFSNTKFVINEGEAYKKVAILEMIENLNEMGYEINISELQEFSKGIINRVHICKALIKHGYIKSVEEGFEKLVGEHCEAYVERKTVPILEAIEAVHNDGGIAIIAHPYEYEFEDMDVFLNDIIKHVDGIECFHPSANKTNSNHLVELCKKHNKLITGGSDYHGDNKPIIHLGMMNVDDEYKIKRS